MPHKLPFNGYCLLRVWVAEFRLLKSLMSINFAQKIYVGKILFT